MEKVPNIHILFIDKYKVNWLENVKFGGLINAWVSGNLTTNLLSFVNKMTNYVINSLLRQLKEPGTDWMQYQYK